jgi:hypothetical protein
MEMYMEIMEMHSCSKIEMLMVHVQAVGYQGGHLVLTMLSFWSLVVSCKSHQILLMSNQNKVVSGGPPISQLLCVLLFALRPILFVQVGQGRVRVDNNFNSSFNDVH